MATPDPKAFYDSVMPEKFGADYEAARWRRTPLLAAQYDMIANTVCREASLVFKHAERLIEVGPGPGTWTKIILKTNPAAAYTLVDISAQMLSQAHAALPRSANITFVESDFLAFASLGSFDAFFSSRAIEYMPDKAAVTRKIAALLAPGARGLLITKTPKHLMDRVRGRTTSSFHSGQIAPRELTRVLVAAGLTVEAVGIATATVPGFKSPTLNRLAYAFLKYLPLVPFFSESYFVRFKRP